MRKTQDDVGAAAATALLFSACSTADALQGVFQVVDQLSTATQAGKTYFGPQTPVDDTFGGLPTPVCQTIGVTRPQVVPPSAGNLAALLLLLHG